jgi:hypothetical protein
MPMQVLRGNRGGRREPSGGLARLGPSRSCEDRSLGRSSRGWGFRSSQATHAASDGRPPRILAAPIPGDPMQVGEFQISELDAWEALTASLATCEQWLISDPLRFAEFEVSRRPPRWQRGRGVEVDRLTRPKQSGGQRSEAYPDIYTSTFLQAMAGKLRGEEQESIASRADALPPADATSLYDLWHESVLSWLKTQLGSGFRVLIADVRDYFPSMNDSVLSLALSHQALGAAGRDECLRVIARINSEPDHQGRPQQGLPVVPADFFWVVADLGLQPVDEEIRAELPGVNHVRWIDDFFLSVRSDPSAVVGRLEAILNRRGLHLNAGKTRILEGPAQFEEAFQTAQQAALDALFRMPVGNPDRILREFMPMMDRDTLNTARLIKRLYVLAARLKSPVFLGRLAGDLARYPAAELAVIRYMGAMGWPKETWGLVVEGLHRAPTQHRRLALIRSLLQFPPGPDCRGRILSEMLSLAADPTGDGSPFATALALGYALKHATAAEFDRLAGARLFEVGAWPSAMARRVAYAFLYAGCRFPDEVLPYIQDDPSDLVRGLARLVEARPDEGLPRRLHAAVRTQGSGHLTWGGLDRLVAQRVLPAALAPP